LKILLQSVHHHCYEVEQQIRWNEHIHKVSGAANRLIVRISLAISEQWCPQQVKEKSYKLGRST